MFLKSNSPNYQDAAGSEQIDGLYSPAMMLIHNPTEAEDLVENTYGCAIAAIGRVRAGSNLKIRPFTILRNVWFNQLRRRRPRGLPCRSRSRRENRESNPETSQDPHVSYATRANRAQMGEAIRKLPVEFREGVLPREYEGCAIRKWPVFSASRFGIVLSPLGAAKSKL
jgi:RNA polymerase sigma-70 factor, ECF subfamily